MISMKTVSLVVLTLHSVVLSLTMRIARTRKGDMFLSSTAVLMPEVVKLLLCLAIVYAEERRSFWKTMQSQVFNRPWDTIKIGIPSILYIIQNNLLFTAASNLDAATYQVVYQLKILTTALLAVLILKRRIGRRQWIALLILVVGVVLVQLASSFESHHQTPLRPNKIVGFSSALGASVLSSSAGIYLEKLLKDSKVSIWIRNVQLSLVSLPLALVAAFIYDYSSIVDKGFFYGYDGFVIFLIFVQATGGVVVAMVLKYADNILKGFATSIAIVLLYVVSVIFFELTFNWLFSVGVILVVGSIYLFNLRTRLLPF